VLEIVLQCGRHVKLSPTVKVDGLHTVQCCYYVVFCCTYQGLACIGCFFSYLSDKRRPDALVSFCYATVCLGRLLNLPDTLRTTQRWLSVGRSVGPALFGQAWKKILQIESGEKLYELLHAIFFIHGTQKM
jgi:hypothetical protein